MAPVLLAVVTVDAKQLRIDEETHKILTSLGQFGETYGDIVKRIAKHYASCPEVRKEKQDSKGRQAASSSRLEILLSNLSFNVGWKCHMTRNRKCYLNTRYVFII